MMNRRNLFKSIFALVAGAFVAKLPIETSTVKAEIPTEGIVSFYPPYTPKLISTGARTQGSFDLKCHKLILAIQKELESHLTNAMGDFNDFHVRANISKLMDQYLEELKLKRCMEYYKIVCDETNNTPDTINNGSLNVDIYFGTNPDPFNVIQIHGDIKPIGIPIDKIQIHG